MVRVNLIIPRIFEKIGWNLEGEFELQVLRLSEVSFEGLTQYVEARHEILSVLNEGYRV